MGTHGRFLIQLLLSVVMAASLLPVAIFTIPAVRANAILGASLMVALAAVSFLLLVRFGPRRRK